MVDEEEQSEKMSGDVDKQSESAAVVSAVGNQQQVLDVSMQHEETIGRKDDRKLAVETDDQMEDDNEAIDISNAQERKESTMGEDGIADEDICDMAEKAEVEFRQALSTGKLSSPKRGKGKCCNVV